MTQHRGRTTIEPDKTFWLAVALGAVAAMVIVGVLVFVAINRLENKIETQATTLARITAADKVEKYAACLQGYQAVARFNHLMDTLATQQEQIVADAFPESRSHQAQRAAIYREAMTVIPPKALCGKKPPGAQ